MTKRFLCVLAGAAVLAACGSDSTSTSDLCDKAASVGSSMAQKLTPCLGTSTPADGGLPTGQTCQDEIAQCNSSDRTVLNTFLDCLNALPTCSDITQFSTQANNCATPVTSSLSAACQSATNISF